MKVPIETLEEKLGYRFKNRALLMRALTHRSWVSERVSPMPEDADNEQLEFLGDSILGFVVSEALVQRDPNAREGQLSQWKAHLVSATFLHRCALAINLGNYLQLGKGEERSGGRERKTLLADAFEAVIAAMHLDGGIEVARKFVQEHVLRALDRPEELASIGLLNYKSVLQERTRLLGLPLPRYLTIGASGPEHAKIFTVEVRIGENIAFRATGSSKKSASQHAAEGLIEKLNQQI
jgi:ribonuclease III